MKLVVAIPGFSSLALVVEVILKFEVALFVLLFPFFRSLRSYT